MAKFSGFDQLSRKLNDFQKALEGLDGQLGEVSFDPNDPASIEAAIQAAETMIDERLRQYESNSMVQSTGEQLKAKYRDIIIQRAAELRAKGGQE
ncbi:hypothetical protein ACFQUU_05030 [Herbaspirillum sp. GCM10030257]|uniref:hypothetical protein n=1 Tax=Herbaspirillum sp. GCM10030257 TaxID=3273393 RepID=UPI00361A8840